MHYNIFEWRVIDSIAVECSHKLRNYVNYVNWSKMSNIYLTISSKLIVSITHYDDNYGCTVCTNCIENKKNL